MRTGGVTAELFPRAASVARFLAACARAGVPFKATAGLHHPMRSREAADLRAGQRRGPMHGFLNVFLAAAFARATGMGEDDLAGAARGGVAAGLPFRRSTARGGTRADLTNEPSWRAAREHFAIAFGSCSFEEPIQESAGMAY